MIPYYLLLIVPLLFSGALQAVLNHGRIGVLNNRNAGKSPMIFMFFLYLTGLLMFRSETVGIDLPNYRYLFYKHSAESFQAVIHYDSEIAYKLLNWLIGKFTTSFRWVMVISALMAVVPIFLLYNEDKRNGYLKMVLFVNTSVFVLLFSGLRQSIAIGIGIFAYHFVRKRKPILFLLMVLLANSVHHSAFILLLMYPIYHWKLNSKHLWLIIPFAFVCYIFKESFFLFLTNLIANFYDKYEATIKNNGALATFLLYLLFSVYSFVIPDEKKMGPELIGLRNLLVLATILQSYASLNTLAMRMNYYFIVLVPYTMCKLVEIPKKSYRRVALISKFVMCIFFTWYFIDTIKGAYNTDNLLCIVPYELMWRWFD